MEHAKIYEYERGRLETSVNWCRNQDFLNRHKIWNQPPLRRATFTRVYVTNRHDKGSCKWYATACPLVSLHKIPDHGSSQRLAFVDQYALHENNHDCMPTRQSVSHLDNQCLFGHNTFVIGCTRVLIICADSIGACLYSSEWVCACASVWS